VTPCSCYKNRRIWGPYHDTFLRNVGSYNNHTASHPRRGHSHETTNLTKSWTVRPSAVSILIASLNNWRKNEVDVVTCNIILRTVICHTVTAGPRLLFTDFPPWLFLCVPRRGSLIGIARGFRSFRVCLQINISCSKKHQFWIIRSSVTSFLTL
jgi:hypothetical protein